VTTSSLTANTVSLATVTMVAFAANSLLCRAALGEGAIDAGSFTVIRVFSGAIALALIVATLRSDSAPAGGDWLGAFWLFAYMICFSFAYLSLSAGTGALILFGAVQITMFAAGLRAGESFRPVGWLGLGLAAGGLAYLVFPGVTAPPLTGASLMAAAGAAWGFYSLRGRGVANPLRATAANFLRAAPMASIAGLPFLRSVHFSPHGVALAVASGAVASGLGYAIWYATLPRLKATSAATLQLSVPVIAAFGGVVFLSERISLRLLLSSVAVLGGIALVLAQRAAPPTRVESAARAKREARGDARPPDRT
jgi:drug/metabolite transporter (DMT)-like permease